MDSRLESFLLGESFELSLRYLGYSVVLMTLFFGQLYLAGSFEMGNSSSLLMGPVGVAVSAVILAGVQADRNDGILVSVAGAVIIMSGYTLYGVVSLSHPQPDYGILAGVGTAVVYGTPIGITTSVIVYALRRVTPSKSSTESKE